MKINKKSQGYTLTEILVVVLVIAVLAAIVYPLYTKAVTKSRAVEAINLLEMVRNKQLQNFAKRGEYLENFSSIENITSNVSDESNSGETIKVKDYTLSLNPEKRCALAEYKKGATSFTFSSSYEKAGLGCTGDICSSFGNIVGTASDICGCSNTCGGGFARNESTCECECNTCILNGQCTGPVQTQPETQSCGNGGTQSRVCTADCNGGVCGAWGPCTGQGCEPSLKPATSQACGNCGTQTRTVTCNNSTGAWQPGAWGTCTGAGACAAGATKSCGTGKTQVCTSLCQWGACEGCDPATKPSTSQACGNCGTQTRTVTCNAATNVWATGSWGTCSGTGECSPNATKTCTGGGTQTCNSKCSWDACAGAGCVMDQTKSCGNCGTQTCGSDLKWGTCANQGVCKPGETEEDACDLNPGYKATRTCLSSCSWGTWTGCPGRKKCGDSCPAGQKRDSSIIYEDEGKCCVSACDEDKKSACQGSGGTFYSTDCSCKCPDGSSLEGNVCEPNSCDESSKPDTSQACGNCNKGTQTRTVTCNTTNKTWTTGTWGTCTGVGTCAAGATQTCSGGTKTCNSSCEWGSCVLNCSDATVRAANKAVCCPGRSVTDTICYTQEYDWDCKQENMYPCYKFGSSAGCNYYYSDCYGACVNECKDIQASVTNGRPCKQQYNSCSADNVGNPCVYIGNYTWYEDSCGDIYGKLIEIDYTHCTCAVSAQKKNGW